MNTLADKPLTTGQLDRIEQLRDKEQNTQPFYVLSLVAEVRRRRDTLDKIKARLWDWGLEWDADSIEGTPIGCLIDDLYAILDTAKETR